MIKCYHSFFILFILIFFPKKSQSQSVEQDSSKVFTINFSNDFIVKTDESYTNGLNFNYSDLRLGGLFLYRWLFPLAKENSVNYYSLYLSQDIYTPVETSLVKPELGTKERPYASTLTIGLAKTAYWESKKIKLHTSMSFGLMGKHAYGKEVQNGFHELMTESDPAAGWDEQLKTDVLLNYDLSLEKGILASKNFEMNALANASIGTLKTALGLGTNFRLGFFRDYFSGQELFDYKKVKGNASYKKAWQVYFSYKPSLNYVVYDATLQGGLILNQSSPYNLSSSEIQNVVLKQDFGFNATYKKLLFQLGIRTESKTIKEGLGHKWGYINLAYRF